MEKVKEEVKSTKTTKKTTTKKSTTKKKEEPKLNVSTNAKKKCSKSKQ